MLSLPGADRETLRARGAPVRDGWLLGGTAGRAAVRQSGLIAFAIDIDAGEVEAVRGSETPVFDPDARPGARDVLERVDGETLDAMGRAWYLGKGMRDPEKVSLHDTRKIEVEGWEPGDRVSWMEALEGLREDFLRAGDHQYEAIDLYCVAEGCNCGEVLLLFGGRQRRVKTPGEVRVLPSGEGILEPHSEEHRGRLAELWAAFQARHPRYRERFARRSAVMHGLAPRIVSASPRKAARSGQKVGRNDPCPCGSGKKHKKCCGVT